MAKPKLALIPSAQGSKFYSVLPSSGVGDFNFTRSGSATRINSQGLIESVANGVSRLNYPLIDGKVVGCPHHILEPQRSNLVLTSARGTYGNNPASEANTTSPDGTNNAYIPTPDSGSDRYDYSVSGGAYATNTKLAYSWYRKRISTPLNPAFLGDLEFKILVNVTQVGSTTQMQSYVNGFDRFQAIFNITDGSASSIIRGYFGGIVGVGNSSVAYFGHQLEEGSYATSYIPTVGSAVTRSAETATGSGDASTFNDSEGVLMAEISALNSDSSYRFIGISDGSQTNRVNIMFNNDNTLDGFVGAVGTFDSDANILNFNKAAIKYKSGDYAFWVNGFEVEVNPSTSATHSGLNSLSFDRSGLNPFYGKTKQVQYYDSALTDSELETLTSWVSFSDMAQGQLYTIE